MSQVFEWARRLFAKRPIVDGTSDVLGTVTRLDDRVIISSTFNAEGWENKTPHFHEKLQRVIRYHQRLVAPGSVPAPLELPKSALRAYVYAGQRVIICQTFVDKAFHVAGPIVAHVSVSYWYHGRNGSEPVVAGRRAN